THISQASGSSADEGTGSIPGVLDVPTDESKDEISWNSTDEEGDDDEGKDGKRDMMKRKRKINYIETSILIKEGRMNEAVQVAVQLQFDRLREEAQKENDEFLKTIDENMQKIIKEQVKEQVKVQVSKILPRIEQTVNEQLEAEVLTWSSNSSKTSYAVATDLSKMELKKILIKKKEGNKSIHRSNE
nr:hypothetical protein [Tanacetum cinerariifolium]